MERKGNPLIYICIPTHNEQQTVGVVLWKLRQVLTEFPRDYQLLVADDASTDKTIEVLEPYTRVLPLTVIRSERRQGYAASLEMLLREAVRRSEYPKRDVIVTLQADFSEEPDDVVAMIKRMEAGADVAVGIKVSQAPQTRVRRLARYLSQFFTRKHGWPEGVVTPFDGYRAYRLYAIKRAIEDQDGRRLIRYDGWAGHAELLRAVLPHARRVETVEVEDRSDRLQRPRRERPFAAALQVRAMAGGSQPPGLLSTEDLDRTAATASRSRDRAVARAAYERPRTNGTNGRDRRPGAVDSRGRSDRAERGRPDSARSEGSGRGGQGAGAPDRGGRPERPPRSRPAARTPANGPDATPETGQQRRAAGTRETPRRSRRKPAEAAGAPGVAGAAGADEARPAGSVDPQGAEARGPGGGADEAGSRLEFGPEGEAPKPKKRRRRRRKPNAAAAEGATAEGEPVSPTDGESMEDVETGGEGVDGEEGVTGERKRRRRGGRRGGRGRRRGPRAEEAGDGPAPESQGGGGDTAGGSGVEAVRRPEAEGPAERPEGPRASAAQPASADGPGNSD